ncbi:1164_t:CDS:2 [Diversispora eburnea]|uniref:1164_t:CDS:1 n=1 Tax=Diversispora eburnea TaxID=1213867 RepID=A0A9N8ZIX7_9GLOM|nr:1164_t:CDS:2 [Diversispora eburnea]
MPPLLLKILNVLAYFLFIGIKFPTFKIIYKTYISPAPYVYGIWGLIHLLFLGFVIYQFFAKNEKIITENIGWNFINIAIVNSTGDILYQSDYLLFSWIATLVIFAIISFVYYRLKTHYPVRKCIWNENLFIHAPFSIYHGWIAVLVVIRGFAAFSEKEPGESPSVLMKILVVLALLLLEMTAVGYIEKFKGDVAGAAVIVWTLCGIAVEQDDPVIRWVAVFFAIFTTFHIIKGLYQIRKSDEEQPLSLG